MKNKEYKKDKDKEKIDHNFIQVFHFNKLINFQNLSQNQKNHLIIIMFSLFFLFFKFLSQ